MLQKAEMKIGLSNDDKKEMAKQIEDNIYIDFDLNKIDKEMLDWGTMPETITDKNTFYAEVNKVFDTTTQSIYMWGDLTQLQPFFDIWAKPDSFRATHAYVAIKSISNYNVSGPGKGKRQAFIMWLFASNYATPFFRIVSGYNGGYVGAEDKGWVNVNNLVSPKNLSLEKNKVYGNYVSIEDEESSQTTHIFRKDDYGYSFGDENEVVQIVSRTRPRVTSDLTAPEKANEVAYLSDIVEKLDIKTFATGKGGLTQPDATLILSVYEQYEGHQIQFYANEESPDKLVSIGYVMKGLDNTPYLIELDRDGIITKWTAETNYRVSGGDIEQELKGTKVNDHNFKLKTDQVKFMKGLRVWIEYEYGRSTGRFKLVQSQDIRFTDASSTEFAIGIPLANPNAFSDMLVPQYNKKTGELKIVSSNQNPDLVPATTKIVKFVGLR